MDTCCAARWRFWPPLRSASLLLAYCTRTWRTLFLAYVPLLLLSAAYAAYALTYGIVPGHTLAYCC